MNPVHGGVCFRCGAPFADGNVPGYRRWCQDCHKEGNPGPVARSEGGSHQKTWEARMKRRMLFGEHCTAYLERNGFTCD